MATTSTTDTPRRQRSDSNRKKRAFSTRSRDNRGRLSLYPALADHHDGGHRLSHLFHHPLVLLQHRPRARSGQQALDRSHNYENILRSDSFRVVTSNTLEWTILSTLGAFVLGFGAALVVQREFIGRGIVRGILLVPWVISASLRRLRLALALSQ